MAKTPILQLPILGSWFVYWGGDTKAVNYHHNDRAEIYALDLMKVNQKGDFFKGTGLSNKDYFSYGQSILAPAEGIVIEAVDGIAENAPTKTTNDYMRFGNSLVIKHEDNLYSVIAHLLTGSVRVKAGQLVKMGQKVGECGNSGNSSGPHLHFHLQDNPILTTFSPSYDKQPLAKGIKPYFDLKLRQDGTFKPYFDLSLPQNGVYKKKPAYSPVRGDIIRSL